MTDDEILERLGLTDVSDTGVRREAIDNVRTIIELRVIGLVSDMIDDDNRAEFERLRESDDTGAVWNWLQSDVLGVDVSEVYEAALRDYLADIETNKFEPND
jgi:hypothetical protein